MRHGRGAIVISLSCLAGVCVTGSAQERTRASIPSQYTWNLTDLYASDAAWKTAKEALAAELDAAAKFKGTLGQSAARLLEALSVQASQRKTLGRLYVYANLAADQDTRVSTYQGMSQEVTQLASDLSAAWSFVEPELLRMDAATIDRYIASAPGLKEYQFYLHDVLRRKAHTLNAREEELLAQTGPMAAGASTISGIFLNADFPWPTIKLSDGKDLRLDVPGYSVARASGIRADRQKAMEAFFSSLGGYQRTLGATLNTGVQSALFETKARRYEDTLSRALDGPNVPRSVYNELVEGVNRHLTAFHRYLKLRKRILGVDELHYYDLYAPLVADVPLDYTVEAAQKEVLTAVRPLGDDYVTITDRALRERWIDYYPSTGKRSGAYMAGAAYDVHPYLLLNYNARYDDVSTLAHELGHAMHSWFSNKTQPFATADYPIFVAEVASTFNEALLIEHMLARITDPKARLSLLGNYLENVKATVFRQTQFAEFELRMHEMAQKGQPLTGEALAQLYLEITRKYYGHDQSVAIVDDYIAHEWAYISHFYSPFYVYQYATSFTASTALAEKVLAKQAGAVERYRRFLAAGGSKYPIDLLKDAGVDMTSPEPLDLTIQKMTRVMDEIEGLLGKIGTPTSSKPQ
jgi:oligoendopeptidase F